MKDICPRRSTVHSCRSMQMDAARVSPDRCYYWIRQKLRVRFGWQGQLMMARDAWLASAGGNRARGYLREEVFRSSLCYPASGEGSHGSSLRWRPDLNPTRPSDTLPKFELIL